MMRPEVNHAQGLYTGVSRAYPLIAKLERVGDEAWRHQFAPSREDLIALQNDQVTPRMEKWLIERKKIDAETLRKIKAGEQ